MSLINQKLSEVKAGTPVRFTQRNGQIIDGIILENDGTESLAVQITSTAVLRYEDISGMEIFQIEENLIQPMPTPVEPVQPKKKQNEQSAQIPVQPVQTIKNKQKNLVLPEIECSKEIISTVFKSLDKDHKDLLQGDNNKIVSYFNSKDKNKLEEALNNIWDVMVDKGLEYAPDVNFYYAYICLLNNEYDNSAKAFFYSKAIRKAYCLAYKDAVEIDDKESYALTAVFAVAYILAGNTKNLDEAETIIEICSEKACDLGAVKILADNVKNSDGYNTLCNIVRYLCSLHGRSFVNVSDDLDKCISTIQRCYINSKIEAMFEEYKEFIEYSAEKENKTDKDNTQKNEKPVQPVDIDPQKVFEGRIVSYKVTKEAGIIVTDDGNEYQFEIKDVTDASFARTFNGHTSTELNIPVKFRLIKFMKAYTAIDIVKGVAPVVKADKTTKSTGAVKGKNLNELMKKKNIEDAIQIYKKKLNGSNFDDEAFIQIITLYLDSWEKEGEKNYSYKIQELISDYEEEIDENPKFAEILLRYYTKIENHAEMISQLNILFEICDPLDYKNKLKYISQKAYCYRHLGDNQSAVNQLMDWLDVVDRGRFDDMYKKRDKIYIEIAENYFEMKDYDNAMNYCQRAATSERHEALWNKLIEILYPDADGDTNPVPSTVSEQPEPEEEKTLEEVYKAYKDETSFDNLGITDTDIAEKISIFKPDQLYCLLTYLKAAAEISSSSLNEYEKDGSKIYVSDALQSLDNAFGYAFNSPLLSKDFTSTEIFPVFENAKHLLGNMSGTLFASAAIMSLFNQQEIMDYSAENLKEVAETYNLAETYPSLYPLIQELYNFKSTTLLGMDVLSDYKTNSSVMDKIIEQANEYRRKIDERAEVHEERSPVNITRMLIFNDKDSVLRKCLDIVADNDIRRLSYVKETVAECFIRSGKPLEENSFDANKISNFIDECWRKSLDVVIDNGGHVNDKHVRIIPGAKTNYSKLMKEWISCICEWVTIADNFENYDNEYAKNEYAKICPIVSGYLSELIQSCEKCNVENGFNWGNESLRRTAEDLLSKINNTYDVRARKYMFIDFLRGEEILLNEEYLPELQSTFCGWENLNILRRIENHASNSLISFEDRIAEILSEAEIKHNFRSLELIRNYGNDMQISSISEYKEFKQIASCQKQAGNRFNGLYEYFSEEMEASVNYGRISDINGEKTSLLDIALKWYDITKITKDYGFYSRILDTIRAKIAVDAQAQGNVLKQQLEELAANPKYNFGIYTKERITSMIDDQNYVAAEQMMNCIRKDDTKVFEDYTIEPFSYFTGFMNEHPMNYRVTSEQGVTLHQAICKRMNCKNFEKAMKNFTNNSSKDARGGCNLIATYDEYKKEYRSNWLTAYPAGVDKVRTILENLGITNCSVTVDGSNSFDTYNVYCSKQTGKINYPHPIPAFSSSAQTEGFRVLCLYGRFTCSTLMETFRNVNTAAKNTIVFLDFALNQDDRRKLARKLKEEKTFSRTFIVVDRVILLYLAKHYSKTEINKMLMAVTMPFAYYQPFVEASNQTMPPELFTGRETELTQIEAPEGANLVYGGRQLGKSALLKMAQRNIDGNANNDRSLLVDIKGMDYTKAAEVVSTELIIAGILNPECQCNDWFTLTSHIKRRLLDDDPTTRINYLLLMLDEADEFIRTSMEDGDVPITALKNLPSGRFKIVMAGLHNLSRFARKKAIGNNSTMIPHLSSTIVRPFKLEEAVKLLTNTLAYLGFKFEDNNIISNILGKTNNFPGLIQLYCQKLIEAMKDDYAGYDQINTPPYKVTESHFRKVLSDSQFTDKVREKLEITLFTEESDHSFYHIIALVFAFLHHTMPEQKDKGYTIDDVIRIAEEYNLTRLNNIDREQLAELLQEMWDLNVLTCEEEVFYRIATKDFREMLGGQDEIVSAMNEYSGEGEQS